jgi:tetratricopeptide (TPR) repeat protein
LEEAEQAHERGLIIARQLGTVLGIANELLLLGEISEDLGNNKKATELLSESLSLYRNSDYHLWEGRAETSLASIYLIEGNLTASRSLLEDSLSVSQLVGRPEIEIRAYLGLSIVKELEGNLAEAAQLLDRALPKLLTLHQPQLAAKALSRSADLLLRIGDPVLARLRVQQAEAAAKRSSDRLVIGRVLGTRARNAIVTGDLAGAAQAAEAQLRLAQEIHAAPMISDAFRNLARIARSEGEVLRARELLGKALRNSSAVGDELACAAISIELARIDLDSGELESALNLATGAVSWYREHRMAGGEALGRALAAEVQIRNGVPAAGDTAR